MPNTPSTYPTLDAWIAGAAIPCGLDAPELLNSAIDRLAAALTGGVELLGFGEALHGGEEILVLRNRLFQRLAEVHGFSAIAIESSFPRGKLVGEYVAGHGPATYEEVQTAGFGTAFGPLAANRELVEWMRAYNANPAHTVKLAFYGFDIPTGTIGVASPRQPLEFVLDYLASVGDPTIAGRRATIAALLGQDADWENPAAILDHTKSVGATPSAVALRIEVEELIAHLQMHRPLLAARSGLPRFADTLHDAVVARQHLNFHAAMARELDQAERLGIRDAMMADNLLHIVARERGRGKVLAFAHNSHLKRGMAQWQLGPELIRWWPAGAQIDILLGGRYAVIGTGLGVSEENGIGLPAPGSLEARLAATPGPVRLIPTQRGQGLPANEVAALPTRSGSSKNPTYFPLTPQHLADFDWLAVLDAATYQRGGPPLQAWDAGADT